MPISDSLKRVAASWLAILKTRSELLTIELEEESTRLFSYLLFSLVALFFFSLAILLVVLLIIVIYWDTHRLSVIAGLSGFFAITAIAIGLSVRNCYRNKPRLLDVSLSELAKDIDVLKPASEETAPHE